MPSADLSKILQVISLLGAAFLAVRLFRSGLWHRYPVFFWYFVFRVPNTLWPLLVKNGVTPGDYLYEDIWIITEPISWVFHVLIVVELCRLVLTSHRGIYSLLRWAMFGSVAVAITISIISLLPKIKPRMTLDTRILGFWFATQRGIDFALAISLLLILFFLSRFPVRLNRNILAHATLYTVFFLGNALTTFLRVFAVSGSPLRGVNAFVEVLSAACIFAWVILLTPAGEKVQASFPNLSPRHEQHALRQLESLNATLLKVSGK
jgi:hypothetical protein